MGQVVGALAADVWSHWSLLEALGSPADLIDAARGAGYEALLLADHESLAGLVEVERAARERGFQALLGVTAAVETPWGRESLRLVGLTGEAWPQLTRAASSADLTLDAVAHPALALILAGPPAGALPPGLADRAGGLFYFTDNPAHREVAGAGPLAASPVRYPHPADRRAFETLAAIGGRTVPAGAGSFRTRHAWLERFGADHPAIRNWTVLVSRVQGPVIPPYQPHLPDWVEGEASDWPGQLADRARAGLARRLRPVPDAYRERLQEELQVIRAGGLDAYFLIVADVVAWARSQGIGVGPGRGSAAGSLTAWALGITDVDPLRWGLVFERFLNPARAGLPDIDLDIEDVRRGELLPYLEQRFGAERVAQIGTFGTLGARAALRDSGRVLGVDAALVDRVARLVPPVPGVSLESAWEESPELRRLTAEAGTAEWWAIARRLEGTPRHQSVHAAGVVIGPGALGAWVPLRHEGGHQITGLSMHDVERLGLMKLDLLGLRTLSAMRRTAELAGEPRLDLTALPEADPETLILLKTSETEGIFQLDGRGVKDLLRRLAPEHVRDIMLAVALFRPGPMEQIGEFLHRRRGAPLPDDEWSRLLADTEGILVYQEQLMAVVREVAGYSWAEADLFRRAVSKKDRELLEGERERFLARVEARGKSRRDGQLLWDRIAAFADYGFNRAHATAYGLLAYGQAFQKAHWPQAFWAAELESMGHGPRLGQAVRRAFQEGMDVLRPHVNLSGAGPEPDGYGVRLGLNAVRGIGSMAVEQVLRAREAGGPFRDGDDARRRLAAMPAGAWEQLAAAGAFLGLAAPHGRPGVQLGLFEDEEEPHQTWEPNDQKGLGWTFPRGDGRVYVRTESAGPEVERAIREAAEGYPGSEAIVVAAAGDRHGHMLDVRLRSSLPALRALRRVEGVAGVARGLEAEA